MINSYKAPSFNDELLTLTHQIAGFLSQMVPAKDQDNSRKIIQITATAVAGEADILYALCDDGTLWWTEPRWVGKDDVWRKVRDIPQEDE